MKCTLLVRGISCIVPGVEGYTDNVRVVSIVGRLLEHSRIYCFGSHDDCKVYLSSADLMTRNMDKRIEIAWPVLSKKLHDQIIAYLDTCMADTAKLRELLPSGHYTPLGYFAKKNSEGEPVLFDSQNELIAQALRAHHEATESLAKREANRGRFAHFEHEEVRRRERRNAQPAPAPASAVRRRAEPAPEAVTVAAKPEPVSSTATDEQAPAAEHERNRATTPHHGDGPHEVKPASEPAERLKAIGDVVGDVAKAAGSVAAGVAITAGTAAAHGAIAAGSVAAGAAKAAGDAVLDAAKEAGEAARGINGVGARATRKTPAAKPHGEGGHPKRDAAPTPAPSPQPALAKRPAARKPGFFSRVIGALSKRR